MLFACRHCCCRVGCVAEIRKMGGGGINLLAKGGWAGVGLGVWRGTQAWAMHVNACGRFTPNMRALLSLLPATCLNRKCVSVYQQAAAPSAG